MTVLVQGLQCVLFIGRGKVSELNAPETRLTDLVFKVAWGRKRLANGYKVKIDAIFTENG